MSDDNRPSISEMLRLCDIARDSKHDHIRHAAEAVLIAFMPRFLEISAAAIAMQENGWDFRLPAMDRFLDALRAVKP